MTYSNQESSQAIILTNRTGLTAKFILFDQVLGKIDAIPGNEKTKNSLLRGGLIEYTRKAWKNIFIITEHQLILSVAPETNEDMLFLHHWLETSILFLPYHQAHIDAYRLLLLIYHVNGFSSIVAKKLVIARFLTALGIYPSDAYYQTHVFFNLILIPLETMLKLEDDNNVHNYINSWLQNCLQNHPQTLPIKTLSFLKR